MPAVVGWVFITVVIMGHAIQALPHRILEKRRIVRPRADLTPKLEPGLHPSYCQFQEARTMKVRPGLGRYTIGRPTTQPVLR